MYRSRNNIKHHDNGIKWKRFPRHWPFVKGIHRSPLNCPHKGQSRGTLFDLCLNKRLSKQSWGWWFETPSRSLWRHCKNSCLWAAFSMHHYAALSFRTLHGMLCHIRKAGEVSFGRLFWHTTITTLATSCYQRYHSTYWNEHTSTYVLRH